MYRGNKDKVERDAESIVTRLRAGEGRKTAPEVLLINGPSYVEAGE